ncbi:MAG: hypothetical protein ABIQ32_09285 [Sphingomicrobium sp.]
MRLIAAALACALSISASAQTVVGSDPTNLALRSGSWAYSQTPAASEASFMDSSGIAQLTIRCVRANRSIVLSMRAVPATSLTVWTSSASRSLPATFDQPSSRLNASLNSNDPLLDALAFSRGRISFSVQGVSPLVLPAWPEPARAIEDCRN